MNCIAVLVCKLPFFYLIKFPKHKSSDSDNMNKEKKKSHKVLPLNEKMKVFNKGEKKKKPMLRLVSGMVRTNLS